MFIPKYTITDKFLSNIKQINSLVLELNNRKFPKVMLMKFEGDAKILSTYASTSIEGNPLPLTDVKKILKSNPLNLKASQQEVINYNKALESLNRQLETRKVSLSLELILKIQKQVMDKLVPVYQLGSLRTEPVFVNDPKLGKTIYWPPDAKDVPKLLKELIDFVNKNKKVIDPLILSGIFHKQFVIIHPFMDGNGRTVRLATKVLLADLGLNTFNLFSFENYYNQNVTRYFQYVGVLGNYYNIVNKIDMTQWLEYFTDGTIDELSRVKKKLMQFSFSPQYQLQEYHQKILNFIKSNGFIKDAQYSKLTNRAKATRTLDFKKLLDLGLIQRKGKGKSTYYILKD